MAKVIMAASKRKPNEADKNTKSKTGKTKKSTACTVFVRFNPPSPSIRRHHLEDMFSEIGPIKKSSVIHSAASENDSKAKLGNSGESGGNTCYAFVKYTNQDDAVKAAAQLNHRKLELTDSPYGRESVQITTQLASTATDNHGSDKQKRLRQQEHQAQNTEHHDGAEIDADAYNKKKKTSRIILRNLSFYAKESHIRTAMESKFGPVNNIHIPTVAVTVDRNSKHRHNKKQKFQHRGFAFVTFEHQKDAAECCSSTEPIMIQNRQVKVALSLNKTAYEKAKAERSQQETAQNQEEKDVKDEDNPSDSGDNTSSDDSDDDNENAEESTSEDDDEDEEEEDGDEENSHIREDDEEEETVAQDVNAVADKRSLFLRNLPFDITRHDIFEAFVKFGYITSIYLVKDKVTGLPKGTAFVSFKNEAATARALRQASPNNNSSFVSQRMSGDSMLDSNDKKEDSTPEEDNGIVLKGRRLLVNLAVDKETASTLSLKNDQTNAGSGKDRRNLYLKGEGRIENTNTTSGGSTEHGLWEDLPESDQLKRQRAFADKNTKLRSPLFFINANRLSIRNLAKHVDESELKSLCVQAIQRGLQRHKVAAEDQIAHWRAAGEMTPREILERIQDLDDDETNSILPVFDDSNVKRYIPSVFIDRDFQSKSNEKALSRGFGFVEFKHHCHALACLRELNNNPKYSTEYAIGGKHAVEMKKRQQKSSKNNRKTQEQDDANSQKIPRLIVEFTVENKAKAKEQVEHRAQQKANLIKQKLEHRQRIEAGEIAQKKKRSRGAKQRERKRKKSQEGKESNDLNGDNATKQRPSTSATDNRDETKSSILSNNMRETLAEKKPKLIKPRKKQKIDKEEQNFTDLVESYKAQFAGKSTSSKDLTSAANVTGKREFKKRWFE